MNTYRTAEVAAIIGIHPNTVRLYEKLKLIPKPERLSNGYRVFTKFHVMQCKLVRIAFQVEILQNGLRKKIAQMITVAATKDFDTATALTKDYLKQLQQERNNAEEAIKIVKMILAGDESESAQCLKRKEVSEAPLNEYQTILNNLRDGGKRKTVITQMFRHKRLADALCRLPEQRCKMRPNF